MRRRFFYGWILVAVAWIIYGFGISPAYYSWGQWAPTIVEDLGFTRGNTGLIFGLFTFLYSGVGPLAGILISRWGVRVLMTAGSLLAASGFYLLAGADSLWECLVYFGIMAGAGIGFSTILPAQTLATNWFVRYRATAVAVIFIAGGIVGRGVTRFDVWILDNYTWREGWLFIAGVSLALAVVAAVFVRDTPEAIGQHPDGRDPGQGPDRSGRPTAVDPGWSAGAAMRTPQFALLCLCGIGYAVPWGVVVAHGSFHLGDLGFSPEFRASAIGTMALVSIVGRLAGSAGDLLKPERVLGVALLIEAAGMTALLLTRSETMAYVSTLAIGIGFGAAYITIAVVFSNFFGRLAFAKTSGTRLLITGTFNAIGPWFAGRVFDELGSYTPAFIVVAILPMIGGVVGLLIRPPAPTTT